MDGGEGLSTIFSPRYIGKNSPSMYARVPNSMALFVSLKIEKLSHIIGTALILEISGVYCLPTGLWLLLSDKFVPPCNHQTVANENYHDSTKATPARRERG